MISNELTSSRSLTTSVFPYREASCRAVPDLVVLLMSMPAFSSSLKKTERHVIHTLKWADICIELKVRLIRGVWRQKSAEMWEGRVEMSLIRMLNICEIRTHFLLAASQRLQSSFLVAFLYHWSVSEIFQVLKCRLVSWLHFLIHHHPSFLTLFFCLERRLFQVSQKITRGELHVTLIQ